MLTKKWRWNNNINLPTIYAMVQPFMASKVKISVELGQYSTHEISFLANKRLWQPWTHAPFILLNRIHHENTVVHMDIKWQKCPFNTEMHEIHLIHCEYFIWLEQISASDRVMETPDMAILSPLQLDLWDSMYILQIFTESF